MKRIIVSVITVDEREYDMELSIESVIKSIKNDIIEVVNSVDSTLKLNPQTYGLYGIRQGMFLDEKKTFEEMGVRNGDSIIIKCFE